MNAVRFQYNGHAWQEPRYLLLKQLLVRYRVRCIEAPSGAAAQGVRWDHSRRAFCRHAVFSLRIEVSHCRQLRDAIEAKVEVRTGDPQMQFWSDDKL